MAQVKAVPDGYSTITPFLNLKGAADALDFYKQAFGAEERMRFITPAGVLGMGVLQIGNSLVRVSEAVKDPPSQSSLALYVEDVDALWKRATDAGCEVVQPLANMFFGDCFGVVKDRFGIRWALATHIEDVPLDEVAKRAAAAMGQGQ